MNSEHCSGTGQANKQRACALTLQLEQKVKLKNEMTLLHESVWKRRGTCFFERAMGAERARGMQQCEKRRDKGKGGEERSGVCALRTTEPTAVPWWQVSAWTLRP